MNKLNVLKQFNFSDYQELFDLTPHPEGSSAWFDTLRQTTLNPGEECVLVVATDATGTARAALPLVQTRNGKLRALTSAYTTIFAPPLGDNQWAYFLGRNAERYLTSLLRLDALESDCEKMEAFKNGLEHAKMDCAEFHHFPNWFEHISKFEDYWCSRPAKLRSTVRRKLKKLERTEGSKFQLAQKPDELRVAISAYEAVHDSSWKQPEPHPDFITALTANLGSRNFIRFGTLFIGDKPIASQLWLVKGTNATIFKLAYRADASEFSPGTLLTYWMLSALAREQKVRTFDFGRGDDTYKREWFSASKKRMGLLVVNKRTAQGLLALILYIWPTRLSKALRKNPN